MKCRSGTDFCFRARKQKMHQICLCTKKLSFSKHLVLLFDENDIYINEIIGIKTFLLIDIKKMASNRV